jgi:hypothetical protein
MLDLKKGAREIMEELKAALEQFAGIVEELGEEEG